MCKQIIIIDKNVPKILLQWNVENIVIILIKYLQKNQILLFSNP